MAKKTVLTRLWVRLPATIILVLILILSVSRLQTAAQIETGAPLESFTNCLDQRIPFMMKAFDIPGVSIAVVRQGELVWTNAYGYSDLEAGRKMTVDVRCRVQSISKPVTTWGVMKLAEQDEIDLDQPIRHYIRTWRFPEAEYPIGDITVRQLLSHTSGLPLGDVFTIYTPGEAMPSLEEKLFNETSQVGIPGAFSYSNTGFNLLELLIEEVTGRDFAEYMQQEVLDPLDMEQASYVWREDFNVPIGYGLSGNAVPVYVYPEKGSGGLFATAADIAAFATAEMPQFSGNPVLGEQSIQLMHKPVSRDLGMYSLVFDGYGLGHYIEYLQDGRLSLSHGGQGTGIMTHLQFVPETGDGIVILTNSQRSWPFIAYVLRDWARWSGLTPVGMSRIILGEYALWTVIGIVWVLMLLQVWRLSAGIVTRRRRFSPLAKQCRVLRALQAGSFVILTAILIWWSTREYTFISSVFPITSVWLEITMGVCAIVLLLSALFPKCQLRILQKK